MVEYHRSGEDVVYGENCICPFQGFNPDLDEPRNVAIIEVLRRIPEKAYNSLDELGDTIVWYIPYYEMLAQVRPFFAHILKFHLE
jgi:hypothetical protein